MERGQVVDYRQDYQSILTRFSNPSGQNVAVLRCRPDQYDRHGGRVAGEQVISEVH